MNKLNAIQILKENEEYISGDEFLKRGRELTKGSMNQEAYDFYSKKENWNSLPDVDYLFFVDSEFCDSYGYRGVRCLYRFGAEWIQDDFWVSDRFGRYCRVAVSASPENLETKNSLEPLPSVLIINGIKYKKDE